MSDNTSAHRVDRLPGDLLRARVRRGDRQLVEDVDDLLADAHEVSRGEEVTTP